MDKITILTPTYNRIDLLVRTYYSLVNQTVKDFIWLIVDDGSTDKTEEMIKGWIKDKKITVKYLKKDNGGKHTAVNYGAKTVNTELTVILDSDDYFISTAIEDILRVHNKYSLESSICGYTFLKMYPDKNLMGDIFPKEGRYNFISWRVNGVVTGDQCDIFFSKYLIRNPFIEYKNEKYIGESTIWIKLGLNYDMIAINKAIYVSEYLEGGLTKSGRILRLKSPNGSMEYANLCTLKPCSTKRKLAYSPIYTAYGLIAEKKIIGIIKESNSKKLTILSIPVGFLIAMYWKRKYNL